MEEKKKWETPKIICLYRGRPEEAVLTACKRTGVTGPGLTNACKTNPSCDNNAGT